MNKLMRKYEQVLLKTCLKVEKDQPLFINYNIERSDFVRIVTEEAYKLGVKDIYYDMVDSYIRKEALMNLEIEDLKKLTFWDKSIWNEYAKKNAAFLILASEMPGLMKDVDPKKISEMTKYLLTTRREFDKGRDKSMIAWAIAAVPTKMWAEELFKNEDDPLDKLWNIIFDICSIKEDDPVSIWNKKIEKLNIRANKLNNYRFKTLIYKSSNGTDFKVDLPDKHLWASGKEVLQNKKEVLVNFPTEEVFTSPDCKSAEGIVYSSKPLSYQGVIINNFNIRFKDGKVVEVHAKEGEETLKQLVNVCKNSNMLGEVALVPYDSPISNSKQVFLETLYDENAACHLALGDSFTECIENGPNMSKDDLFNNYNLNKCDSHTDFMIGTSDLNITGITHDNKEVPIFINGNFTEEFN